MPSVLVRFGTKQRRRFAYTKPEAIATLKEIGALIGSAGVAPDIGARLLTDIGAGTRTAHQARQAITQIVKAHGAHKAGPELTLADLGKAWTTNEIAAAHPDHVRAKRSAPKDAERLAVLCRSVGKVPVRSFTLAHAKLAMAALPRGLSSATRRQYAQILVRLMNLAVYPLEIIDRSPLPRGFLPKVTRAKATAWLYPAEDARLLACTRIPLARRVLYGVLAREGLRCGDALGLQWTDLDLERGAIRLDTNKTDDPRAWALAPGVAKALEQWQTRSASDRVFSGVLNEGRLAEAFRADLALAKVDRPELFERSASRVPIRVHDLRATFVTLALANGRSESWVSDRTGHRSSVMIQQYRRAARTAAELDLGELAPLDRALAWAEEPSANAGRYGPSRRPPRAR